MANYAVSNDLVEQIVLLRKKATNCGEYARNERPPFDSSYNIPRLREELLNVQSAVNVILEQLQEEDQQRLKRILGEAKR